MSLPHALSVSDSERVAAVVEMVLAALRSEFPVHLVHLVRGPADLRPARELYPAFHGAFDWHSSVHGHWTLARLARLVPGAPWRARALATLATSLTAERLAGELDYLSGEGRQGFERPYGLAWLLQLAAELREWTRESGGDAAGREAAAGWLASLLPLETLAAGRIVTHVERLAWPVRGGEHAQTAFALGLALDWARAAGRDDVTRTVTARAERFFAEDRDAPVAYEPSGHDFLSPALGEADLMRRVREGASLAAWLERFLPDPRTPAARAWLTPVASPDPADGKLAHLDGLNLSRAWMLDGIAASLAASHPWRQPLTAAILSHAEAGLASVPAEHYAGSHWLGSFAVYLVTRRGFAPEAAATGA